MINSDRPKRKKGERRQGTCVYCGGYGPITKDHVFPQVLFRVLDKDMLTVRSCDECQQLKSLGDRDLWIYINLDMLGGLHEDAEYHLRKIFQSNEATTAWLKEALDASEPIALRDDYNELRGVGWSISFNFARIVKTMEMMTRGLYSKITGSVLPQDTPINVMAVPWNFFGDHMRAATQMSQMSGMRPVVKGNRVAWYLPHIPKGVPEDSVQITVCFNDHVGFELATGVLAESMQRGRSQGQSKKDSIASIAYLLGPTQPTGVRLPKDRRGRTFIPPS